MDMTSAPLQGTLGYVLIGEIAGVVTLSWLCIGVFIRKLKESSPEHIQPATSPISPFRVEDSPEYLALLKKIEDLEAKAQVISPIEASLEKVPGSDVEKLQQTISYLENKLLEYEIVQEEIATLGELKKENEKLKSELVELKNAQVNQTTEQLIDKNFSEFSDKPVTESAPLPSAPLSESDRKEPTPGEIENLLSDIENLAQETNKKD